jgi:hypothetical protein
MNRLWYCVIATLVAFAPAELLKVGALFTNTMNGDTIASGHSLNANGQAALDLWQTWVNSASLSWTVEVTYGPLSDAAAMSTAGNDLLQHVIFCPYTTGLSKTCIDNIAADFKGPIIVWGGATDSIFSTGEGTGNCQQRSTNNCFGFLPKASTYMTTGLELMMSPNTAMTVGLIENNNGFSAGVCDGANATINAQSTLMHARTASLEVSSSGDTLSQNDVAMINGVIRAQPDIIVVCGHNKNVEPVIVQIGNSDYRPKAIIATNSITAKSDANYGNALNYQSCVMMPQPWAESDATVDPVIGWTTTAFKAALAENGHTATYHTAACGAGAVAITNAMNKIDAFAGRPDGVAAAMKNLDVPSYYGQIGFGADGSWSGPMYTQQKQTMSSPIVAPVGDAATSGTASKDLSQCSGWEMPTTCSDVKQMYRDQNCCGNPMSSFSMGTRRLSHVDDDEALLARVRTAMQNAKSEGGDKQKLLAKQLQDALEM